MNELDQQTKRKLRETYLKVSRTGVAAIMKRIASGLRIDDVEDWLAAFIESSVEGITLKERMQAGKRAGESLPVDGLDVEHTSHGRVKFNNMKLENCPFCGGTAAFQEMKNDAAKWIEHRVCVQCEHCLARTKMQAWKLDKAPETREQLPDAVRLRVITAWNNRALAPFQNPGENAIV